MAAADWAGLHPPLLQSILQHVLGHEVLQLPSYLAPTTAEAATARRQQAAIAAFSLVCRQWRTAAAAALQQWTWAVAVQRAAEQAADALTPQLEQLAVASLDLRRLTWSESGSAAAEALLHSAAFRRRSGGCLRRAVGIPERLCSALAAGFPNLEAVGLSEDYNSTDAHQHHSAPMHLAPLAALPLLRTLQLELGIVELGGLPPQVRRLQLVEIDRLVLPPAPGASIADRLLAAAAARGEPAWGACLQADAWDVAEVLSAPAGAAAGAALVLWRHRLALALMRPSSPPPLPAPGNAAAGLDSLALEAASGCVVFEEANHAPMELELSHMARLLAAAACAAWRVRLGVCPDAALQQQRACLEVTRAAATG